MRVVVLFSGGKDSVYATHLCLSWGWEVEWLTLHPQADSMMFHHPNTRWCKWQAKAAGIKWHEIEVKHETELEELEKAIGRLKVQGIVSGAVASEYQKQRIEVIGERLKLPTYAPLWHKNADFLREMLSSMEVCLVSASAEGLDGKWLGRRLVPEDVSRLEAMKPPIHPFLEGGEGETFVCDAPFFKKRIEILEWKKEWAGMSGRAEIKKARLAAK
ncbi:MAG: diphthine--ammonia ligase [Candidatus Marsarchaeota archaeon]|nr:diphthine--ammonia ligase [Candidatus Marsarchaeota archaeon]